NLIIVSIISCFWFLGIIAAIIYTFILFVVIRKHYNNISNKYNKLLEAANKIAEGNLDITIEDDLGVFNAFKKEIESIQKGFKKAVNEEVKSQRMKTELITNVSHDLKTPLTSIITYVDLLKDENLSVEKRKEYLDTLDRKSQRLQELIEDLFEVSKATSGNIHLNIVDVDVVDLMKQTLLELDDKILKSSLIIKTNYPKSKVLLPLDSQRIFRVFENLIINITKYAMKGSRVYIDISSIEDKVEITLKNMAANEIDFNVDEIAERFVRGDKARNAEGSGLGLAIAKSFVELQGGELNISVDGDLFKVIITFPKINI
ncbi:MAG: sensor histidine kinase, partial [Clostridiaceae bacterium]|nr:sensor histidine kinase [Clostridiaceae bacterium]